MKPFWQYIDRRRCRRVPFAQACHRAILAPEGQSRLSRPPKTPRNALKNASLCTDFCVFSRPTERHFTRFTPPGPGLFLLLTRVASICSSARHQKRKKRHLTDIHVCRDSHTNSPTRKPRPESPAPLTPIPPSVLL